MPRRKKTKKGKSKGGGATTAAGLEEPLLPDSSGADGGASDLEAGNNANEDGSSRAAAASSAVAAASSTTEVAAAAAPPAAVASSPRRRAGKGDPMSEVGAKAVDAEVGGGDDAEAESLLPTATAQPIQAELVIEQDAISFADRLDDSTVQDDGDGVVLIVAPATLPPNYTFVATLPDGRAFTVTVSSNGIAEGETMEVPFPLPHQFLATTVVPPRGYWKDGLCGCFSLGCCHPVLCLSWCCPLVALGQINTRLQLSWLSSPAPPRIVKWTFTTLVTITLIHFITTTVLSFLGRSVDTIFYRAESIFSLVVVLFRVYVIAATRRQVRAKYEIRESAFSRGCCCGCCRPCDDCCAALFCSCCSVGQMLRHTADYETFRATCCTGTGLPPNAPVVV